MKGRDMPARKSVFWSRLLGLLISFAIIAVLVFGGVNNLMSELSDVYHALADSQSELGVTQFALKQAQADLDESQTDLAAANNQLNTMQNKLVAKIHHLRQHEQALNVAANHVQKLNADREDLKRGLREASSAVAHSMQLLAAKDGALRAVEAELERQRQAPQLSVVVTTERYMQTSYRERFAATHVQLLYAGDGSGLFYDGKMIQHEIEKSAVYAERTQVVYTQTAPGEDVLECLEDAERRRRRDRRGRCGQIIAVQNSAMQMQAYAYQSHFSGAQMMMIGQ